MQIEVVPGKRPTTNPPTTLPPDQNSSSNDSIGAGAIVAIVIGSIIILFGLLNFFGAIWMWRKRKTTYSTANSSVGDQQPLISHH